MLKFVLKILYKHNIALEFTIKLYMISSYSILSWKGIK